MLRFVDVMVNTQELARIMVELPINEVMVAQTKNACLAVARGKDIASVRSSPALAASPVDI